MSTPDRWEPVPVNLSPFAGQQLTLTLAAEADDGTIAYWGTPVVRSRGDATRVSAAVAARQELGDAPASHHEVDDDEQQRRACNAQLRRQQI